MGLLSNRYDVEDALNNAMTKTAQQWGQLDRSVYAPMTASTALQGSMFGQSMGAMLGGQQPEIQKQNIIDEIMKKHPDPRTVKELQAVANDLQAAGLFDMAIKVREVANETAIAQSKVEKAAKPSKDLLDQISFGLTSSFLTEDFITKYMNEFHKDYMAKYAASKDKKGDYSPTNYQKRREQAKSELENQFKAYRKAISRDKRMGIDEINSLLSNETLLLEDFKEWAKKRSGNRMSTFLDTHMIIGRTPTTQTGDGLSDDGTNLQTDTDHEAVGYTSAEFESGQMELDQASIDVDRAIESMGIDEMKLIRDEALKKPVDQLRPLDKILINKIEEKLGLPLTQFPKEDEAEKSASAFRGDTQQWFIDALGMGGEAVV